jgi:hypothetical protein
MIKEKLGLVNYQLQLLKSMLKIHPVFYISLLEPALKHVLITKNMEINNNTEQEYKVKQILNHKQVSRKPYYLIK